MITPTQRELKSSVANRLELALKSLLWVIGQGAEFPDAAHSVAQLWNVPQSQLEAAYDAI
jgi:hypothetical protein